MRQLWLAAIIIRGIALLIGLRKAPVPWLWWVAFSEVTSIILRTCDYEQSGVWYLRLWIAQQIGSIILLAWLIAGIIKPPGTLVLAATLISCTIGIILSTVLQFPDSPVEPVLIGGGLAVLAMGLMSAVVAVATFRADRYILAIYLVLGAFLMLTAPGYLKQAGLGRAWEVLEIAAFSAWGIYYLRHGPSVELS